MEWRLWEGDEPPFFTQPDFFRAHARIPGWMQRGHAERITMVHEALDMLRTGLHPLAVTTLSDIGCGDGSFLSGVTGLKTWGYDAGEANVAYAEAHHGLNVRRVNILEDELTYGDVTTITEVLEHLVDPGAMLRKITSHYLIATSPSAESDKWHYEHHAWAWDRSGYQELVTRNGWSIIATYECEASWAVEFGPVVEEKKPRFQCVVAERAS